MFTDLSLSLSLGLFLSLCVFTKVSWVIEIKFQLISTDLSGSLFSSLSLSLSLSLYIYVYSLLQNSSHSVDLDIKKCWLVLMALGTGTPAPTERRGREHGSAEAQNLHWGFCSLCGQGWVCALGLVLSTQRYTDVVFYLPVGFKVLNVVAYL